MPDDREQGLQKSKTPVRTVFGVDSIPQQYTWAVWTYLKNRSVRKAQHTNACEPAGYFWMTNAS